jgi:hypothetical protein
MNLLQRPKIYPAKKLTVMRRHGLKNCKKVNEIKFLTSLSFIANIIAPACSAAFPTIGSKITPINEIGIFQV